MGNVTPTHQGINRAGRASWRSRQQPNVTVTPLLRKCHTTVATVPVTRPTFTALVAADMYRRWASGRRRAYRRRTVAPYRRRGRKVRWRPRVRRSYRRSVPARRFKRRVLAISQTKKSDKMLGATSTGTIQPITLATGFNSVAYNLWSPPTREYDNQEVDPQDRNRPSPPRGSSNADGVGKRRWATITNAADKDSFFAACAEMDPRALVTSFGNVSRYANWKYPDLRGSYDSPDGISVDLSGYPELRDYFSSWLSQSGR